METRVIRSVGLFLVVVVMVAVALLSACSRSNSVASAQKALPKVDGIISPNEYEHHYHSDQVNIDLYWTIDRDQIFFGLHSTAQGWLAMGLDPDGPAMKGADIVFGYFQDGKAVINDEYAPTISSHVRDIDLGGTDDLFQRAGSRDPQGTTIEWVRKLLTGDRFDRSITAGNHLVMFAFSDTDDPTGYHGEAGKRRAEAFLDFFHPEL
jgi:hypothetical protein